MGYTHYYTQLRNLRPAEMEAFADFAKKAADLSGVPLANGFGEDGSLPLFTADEVCFNGVGEDSHETFLVEPKGRGFQFTKTSRKPYDIVVVACLAYLDTLGNAFRVNSDGGYKEWEAGIALAKRVRPDLDYRAFEDEP